MVKKRSQDQGRQPAPVREPFQVYLDQKDRELLERIAERTGLARAEVLRRGLRSLGAEALTERAPGASLRTLVGVLGDKKSVPTDLAERHDHYLAKADEAHARRTRVD
jgi:hypothetical protein